MTKIEGSGSISQSQRHGSADPDRHKFIMFFLKCLRYVQGFGSVSGSAWIRINLSCWIRIRIQIADPDPGGQK
jgi:hypothetical protein